MRRVVILEPEFYVEWLTCPDGRGAALFPAVDGHAGEPASDAAAACQAANGRAPAAARGASTAGRAEAVRVSRFGSKAGAGSCP